VRLFYAEPRYAPSSMRFGQTTSPHSGGSAETLNERRILAPARWDGSMRREGSEVHIAADTRGHPLMLKVRPADERQHVQVAAGHGGATGDRPREGRSKSSRYQ
jgi:hypothetical protein